MTKNYWKLTLGTAVLALAAAACNLPGQTTAPAPTENAPVATAVAETLAAQPSAAAVLPSLAPTATPAEMQPSATPEPTQTPIPTLTPPPTPTPQDWKAVLGAPAGKDTLDGGGGFGLKSPYEDDYSSFRVSGGVLTAASKMTNGWRSWRLRPPAIKNFYLEGSFAANTCGVSDGDGLVFRAPNYDSGHGFYFGVTCGGGYSLSRWDSTGTTSLASSSGDPAVQGGTGQTNRLGVKVENDRITLYINDKLITEINGAGLSDAGYYGLYVAGSSGSLSVNLDEIAYWNLP